MHNIRLCSESQKLEKENRYIHIQYMYVGYTSLQVCLSILIHLFNSQISYIKNIRYNTFKYIFLLIISEIWPIYAGIYRFCLHNAMITNSYEIGTKQILFLFMFIPFRSFWSFYIIYPFHTLEYIFVLGMFFSKMIKIIYTYIDTYLLRFERLFRSIENTLHLCFIYYGVLQVSNGQIFKNVINLKLYIFK